ncbi:MAG: RNA methyltransferase [Pyrinomonadaceae bacterium]|nr:RNA methyltransferase [Pyrinomonadaceae bacterium]
MKFARMVRDGKVADKFFVEGVRLVSELIGSNISVDFLFLSESTLSRAHNPIELLKKRSERVFTVSDSVFPTISDTKNPQGVAAICARPKNGKEEIQERIGGSPVPRVAVLHGISNPGNLGAVLRSAEAFGIDGVIVTDKSTSPFGTTAVRGSMGAIFRMPVWSGEGFTSIVEWSKELGLVSVCAEPQAGTELSSIDWKRGMLIVFGSEAHGLMPSETSMISESFKIRMAPEVESLNLAVAVGIVFYESCRTVS